MSCKDGIFDDIEYEVKSRLAVTSVMIKFSIQLGFKILLTEHVSRRNFHNSEIIYLVHLDQTELLKCEER